MKSASDLFELPMFIVYTKCVKRWTHRITDNMFTVNRFTFVDKDYNYYYYYTSLHYILLLLLLLYKEGKNIFIYNTLL